MIAARGTLQSRLFRAFVLVTVIAVAAPALLSHNALYRDGMEMAGAQALAQATAFKRVLDAGMNEEQMAALLGAVKEAGERLTITGKNGEVRHDSHVGADTLKELDNHGDRPEIEAARADGAGISLRHGNTLGFDAVYAAVLLHNGDTLRLAVPQADIRRGLERRLSGISVTLAGVATLCLFLTVLITRKVRSGIDAMADVVAAIAENKGGRRLLTVPGEEFLPLARAVNNMAGNIEEYVAATTDQRTQLEIILDSMHEGVLVLGPTGHVRRCNRALLDLFPEAAKAMDKPLIESVPVPALQHLADQALGRDCPLAEAAALRDTGAPRDAKALHFEHGGRFLVAHVSRPVAETQSIGAVLVLYDATHIMRLERARRDFVANVSHELRTPLTAISGYAEAIMQAKDIAAEHRHFAGIIHKHAGALARVVDGMLALARVEDAREAVRIVPLDPAQPLHEAMRLCADMAEAKELRFAVFLEAGGPVMGNAPLLTQVFRNLFENACRHSPQGGKIGVSAVRCGSEALFAVTDDGPGIPKGELARIFERLYQVKHRRSGGSSGIGLAICKHIIERHGGRIWAESPYRESATAVLFTLPLAGTAEQPGI